MRCLLVDKITGYEKGRSITGIKNVTMSENFLQDHFPGFPVMPGVLQLEAVSQLGSWLIFATTGSEKMARLESAKTVKFKEYIVPGDQLRMELELTALEATRALFNARVLVNGRLKTEIERGRLRCTHTAALEDPNRAGAHFDFITGKAPMGVFTK